MANKKYLMGILLMVLVFGMAVIGCDNDSTDDNGGGGGSAGNPFVGSWRPTTSGVTGTLVLRENLTGSWVGQSLTYSYSGNTATIRLAGASSTATVNGNTLEWAGARFTK